jgi:hypothetical protein
MNLPRLLILMGLSIAGLGLILWLAPRVPGLDRLGKLPGDIRHEGKNVRFYFPWVTCLLLSVLLTLLFKIVEWFRR